MKKFLFALIILFAVNFSAASAEIIPVEGEGRYVVDKNLKKLSMTQPNMPATRRCALRRKVWASSLKAVPRRSISS